MAAASQLVLTPQKVLGDLSKLDMMPSKSGAALQPTGTLERLMFSNLPLAQQQQSLELFRAVVDLPKIDLHTHYDSVGIAENKHISDPLALFLGTPQMGFDHYAATVMRMCGVSEGLVSGRPTRNDPAPDLEMNHQRFLKLVASMERSFPNPSSQWFAIAMERVMGLGDIPVKADFAEQLWQQGLAKLRTDEFRPQQIFTAGGIKIALTTDDPTANLDEHVKLSSTQSDLLLLPTWRPDPALMLEGSRRVDFNGWVKKLEAASGVQIDSLDAFKAALSKRMDHFASRGCIACDIGLVNFHNVEASDAELNTMLSKKLSGGEISPDESAKWKTHMLRWLCTENAERGWVQYFHQGPARDLNPRLFDAQGADVGGDAPGQRIDREAFPALLSYLVSQKVEGSADGTGLAKSVIFTINSEDYPYVIDTINRFQSNEAGIQSKLQIGPPWWFNDTNDGNRGVIKLVAERGILQDWVGMLSDARVPATVISRIDQFRALLSQELVAMHPGASNQELFPIAKAICFENAMSFLGFKNN